MRLPGPLRAKAIVATHGRSLAVVFAVVGILALAGAGWWFTHPPTAEVTDHTAETSVGSTVETSAVVTGNSSLYDRGDRLSNEPVYFREASPTVTVRLRTALRPPNRSAVVDQEMHLVVQAKRGGEVFWSRNRSLAATSSTVDDGAATTAATISVPELDESLQPIRREVGAAGTVSAYVRVRVHYETDRYEGVMTERVPIRIEEDSYSLPQRSMSRTETTPRTHIETIQRTDTTTGTALLLLGVGSFAGAIGAFVGFRRFDATAAERALHRERFAEWISTGSLGPGVGERYVHVESLADLVDVGIDAGRRVIHDPELDTYAVIDDDVVYHYGHASLWHPERQAATSDGGVDDGGTDADATGAGRDGTGNDRYGTGDAEAEGKGGAEGDRGASTHDGDGPRNEGEGEGHESEGSPDDAATLDGEDAIDRWLDDLDSVGESAAGEQSGDSPADGDAESGSDGSTDGPDGFDWPLGNG